MKKTQTAITELLKRFQYTTYQFEKDAVEEAVRRKNEVVPHLLDVLADAVDRNFAFYRDTGYTAHYYALLILTELCETRAHLTLLQLCLMKPHMVERMWGEFLGGDIERALAATCGGDYSGIAMLIGDESVHLEIRCAAVDALLRLVAFGQVKRADAIECLREQFHKIERTASKLWGYLIVAAEDLGAMELAVECMDASRDDLVCQDWDTILAALNEDPGDWIENLRARLKDETLPDRESDGWWNPTRRF